MRVGRRIPTGGQETRSEGKARPIRHFFAFQIGFIRGQSRAQHFPNSRIQVTLDRNRSPNLLASSQPRTVAKERTTRLCRPGNSPALRATEPSFPTPQRSKEPHMIEYLPRGWDQAVV
jgi:hypothetical protein